MPHRHRHKTNFTFALIGILLMFFGPALFLLYLGYQAHDDKTCRDGAPVSYWPTEEYMGAFLALGGVFLVVGIALMILLFRKR